MCLNVFLWLERFAPIIFQYYFVHILCFISENSRGSPRSENCELQVRLLVAIPNAPAPSKKIKTTHLRLGHFADC